MEFANNKKLHLFANEFALRDGNVPRNELHTALALITKTFDDESVIVDENWQRLLIKTDMPADLPAPPEQYGLKGGAARYVLLSLSGGKLSSRYYPRDFDLFRIGTRPNAHDWKIAERFMPEDAAHGRGIELVSNLHRYLRTRDLTINELCYLNGTLTVSFQGVLDTFAAILRPSRYRSGSIHQPKELQGGVTAKILRLQAELGDDWVIEGLPLRHAVRPFDLALHLNRALARSPTVALAFMKLCREHELLPAGQQLKTEGLLELVEYLASEVEEGLDFFTYLPRALRKRLDTK